MRSIINVPLRWCHVFPTEVEHHVIPLKRGETENKVWNVPGGKEWRVKGWLDDIAAVDSKVFHVISQKTKEHMLRDFCQSSLPTLTRHVSSTCLPRGFSLSTHQNSTKRIVLFFFCLSKTKFVLLNWLTSFLSK